jgi:dTDP-4-dehydrorhamnose reductase
VRILVTGAKGMLAYALLPCLGTEHDVVGVDVQDFDISQGHAVHKAFREVRPKFVFHLAAYTDVDGCEARPEIADAVNNLGTQNVARSCAEIGAALLYVSTDYVFDGSSTRSYREDDVPNPLSVYGQSKLGGEKHVQSMVERHFIVRSSWLYGPRGKNFVATILKAAKERRELRVVSDQRGSPTYTQHLAMKLAQMPRIKAYGIYHITGAGNCSWFEFTQTILKLGGFGRVRVVPISTEESGRRARRPAYSVLENRRLIEAHLGALPHWTEGLGHYLKEGQHLEDFRLPVPVDAVTMDRRREVV